MVVHIRRQMCLQRISLQTDRTSLKWLHQMAESSHQVPRWHETLTEFDFGFVHETGIFNGNADGLIRKHCNFNWCDRIQTRDGGPPPVG